MSNAMNFLYSTFHLPWPLMFLVLLQVVGCHYQNYCQFHYQTVVCKKLNHVAILSENQHILNEACFPLLSLTNAIFLPKTNLTKNHN